MSHSIGSNLKTIVRSSISIPVELVAVTIQVVADATNVTSDAISGTVPTVKQLGTISGHFVMGAVNSELSEKELKEKTAGVSFGSLMDNMQAGSGGAGQSTTKAISGFFADEVQS